MSVDTKKLAVVLAGAGDVEREIDQIREAVGEVNRTMHFAAKSVTLDPIHWRTHAYPGLDQEGAQGLIDPHLRIDKCDIFIAVFWKRFGTPVYDAESGTEHEVRRAVASWKSQSTPRIMLYFSKAPYSPRTVEETEQWGKVLRFKQEFLSSGYITEYDQESFSGLVRGHLTQFCFEFIKTQAEAAEARKDVSPIACRVESSRVLVRAEGIAELIADIVLTFTGDLPVSIHGVIQSVDISLLLNTTITNRLMPDFSTDALLVHTESRQTAKIARGTLVAPNVLLFRSVAIDTPADVRSKTFRITNVRANAGSLSTAPGLNVVALVRVEDVPVTDSVQTVGWIKRGLAFGLRNADSSDLIDGKQPVLRQSIECSGQRIATLRFIECFNNAFKLRGTSIRGDNVFTYSKSDDFIVAIGESAQFNKICVDNQGSLFMYGLADFGTRLLAVFNNVPAGVSLFVSARNTVSSSPACIDAFLTQDDVSPFSPVQETDAIGGVPVTQLTVTNGTALATWEVIRRDQDVIGWLEFGVFIRFKSEPAKNSPALGTALITADLAPSTTVITASPNHAVPRFQRLSGTAALFTIGR